ncbi:MAG: hypothetical protein H0X37_26105 [Herpetosiphonaceae bacterium]|nr:hypothetical protein [Herpetosiphonaceae bacterium]
MSERRSVAGELPDGVVPAGQEHNPNPPDEVAANRARFEARQQELQADRQQAEDVIEPLQAQVEEQYRRAQDDPAHQAMIPEQIAHSENEHVHQPGGQVHTPAPHNPEAAAPLAAPLSNLVPGGDEAGADDTPHVP